MSDQNDNNKNDNNQNEINDIHQMTMDDKGNIRNGQNGIVVLSESIKIYTILGWVSISLASFVSPIFAIAGIIFGVLVNKKVKGRGNIIIIASVVLGLAKVVLSYLFLSFST